jgi:deoxyribonuclease NucA/NucB
MMNGATTTATMGMGLSLDAQLMVGATIAGAGFIIAAQTGVLDDVLWSIHDLLTSGVENATLAVSYVVTQMREVGDALQEAAKRIASYAKQAVAQVLETLRKIPKHYVIEILTPYICRNTIDHLKLHPHHYVLVYNGGDKAAKDRNRREACYGKDHLRDPSQGLISLDEFPYASTRQGGLGASVAAVPVHEQATQSITLNAVYRHHLKYRVGPFVVIPLGGK